MRRGKVGKDELLKAESASYHSPGTCTFYGTANTNQMMMELMGLHIPNAAFINPGTPLRQALTRAAVHRLAELARSGERPLAQVVDERAIVNAMAGLLATGGSTNHAIHLPAIARAAGIRIDWQDFEELSTRRSAARANLSQWREGRERLPGRRRDGVRYLHPVERRPDPHRRADRGRGFDGLVDRQSGASRRRDRLEDRPRKAPTSTCFARSAIRSARTAG